MTEHLPVAVVGAGIIGANHAAAVLRHPRLRLAALVDPDTAATGVLAGTLAPGVSRYATLADAVAGEPIGLVAVCTPTGLHATAAEEALGAGAHVVVEKPLDVSLRRARHLADVAASAAARGLVASVVSQHRFDPASVATAAAVRSGSLGELTSAVASVPWWRGQAYYDSAEWRGTWRLDGGGALMNQGVHTVDLLVWLLGQPVEVFAYTTRMAHERIEVEDVAVAVLRFPSGALATLHATTAGHPGLGVRLQLQGSRGSAVIHDDQLEYLRTHASRANQAVEAVGPDEVWGAAKPADSFVVGHLRQYDDVVAAIDGNRPPGVTVHDGLVALAVVEAVYLSAALGRPIDVAGVLGGSYDEVRLEAAR
ncbi:Gfo/Idh/MocA family protein [Virgisporangium aurantiacum]|uniref:Oxidoreductase n=1 Tax=Virgisporangium aurantiacum TaxID=175570 RepID=A0A8J4E086_9ACTN|nr:Gfo/Idh/MocA family oxidoreductase [Virgisporangium aurantiacum]GIJ56428.1 oxidoreductase [Virgisporangium aurantiacum]